MKKVLYITSRQIYPITGGREVVLYNYCKGLSKKYGCTVDLFCLENGKIASNIQDKLEFINKIFYGNKPGLLIKLKNVLCMSLIRRKWPMQVSIYYNEKTLNELKYIIQKEEYDVVICDMARTAEYLRNIEGVYKVLDMNDLISNRYYRQYKSINKDSNILGQLSEKLPKFISHIVNNQFVGRMVLKLEADLLKKYELGLIDDFEDIIFVSYMEAQQYDLLTKRNKSLTIPIGVDYEYYSNKMGKKSEKPCIVFLGNMFISHNRDAVNNFVNNIFPYILKEMPEVIFKIVGKCDENYKKIMQNKSNIELTGMVDDIREHVQQGWIAVAPLTYGSGVKTKVLETMSMGLPVVTNSIGAEGIYADDEDGLFIEDNNVEMATIIKKLLKDSELLDKSSRNASKLIKCKYTWDNCLNNFEKIIDGDLKEVKYEAVSGC